MALCVVHVCYEILSGCREYVGSHLRLNPSVGQKGIYDSALVAELKVIFMLLYYHYDKKKKVKQWNDFSRLLQAYKHFCSPSVIYGYLSKIKCELKWSIINYYWKFSIFSENVYFITFDAVSCFINTVSNLR